MTRTGVEMVALNAEVGERKVAVTLPAPCTAGFQLHIADDEEVLTPTHPPIFLLLYLKVTNPSSEVVAVT